MGTALPSRINKKYLPGGFTLVEFLIVFAITAIIIAFVIPAFNNFNRSQSLKTAASELKTNLRQAQNKALSGEKDCLTSQTLMGWYVRLDTSTTYTIASRCIDDSGNDIGSDFLAKSYTAKNISGISKLPVDVDFILFEPVSKGISFYKSSFLSGNKLDIESVVLTLTGLDDRQYSVSVSSSGEIVDAKTP